MNMIIRNLLSATLVIASASAVAASLPNNIIKQLPSGYTVLSYKEGKLNNDKLSDFIVVLHKSNEKSISTESEAPDRPLLLFIQNTEGNFTLTKRNDHVVFKVDQGGQCDPFEGEENGLAIKNHYFTIENGVACGQHWSDFTTFRYVPELHDWAFHKRINESWGMNHSKDPNADALVMDERKVVTGKGKPPVLFENYLPD